ncbi:hypothetical protein BP6252_12432 [Coleophoma cylindrospora]|uniref:DNA/RNA-binding protein Alba-like domain-containing protein n=1 Tax=Coleophoma cylindrospora TaxID=1849047 RepID=A0A3D8QGZ1_9HELO|nr:hypothetical protein BP6252_12432 [Coleophoma cylindrospora]
MAGTEQDVESRAKNSQFEKRKDQDSRTGNQKRLAQGESVSMGGSTILARKKQKTSNSLITTSADSTPAGSAAKSNEPAPSIAIPSAVSSTHEVTTMSIGSNSHIQQKVTRILDFLCKEIEPSAQQKAVMLYAKGPTVSKMISIVEIAKREIGQVGQWYQYNLVESKLSDQPKTQGNQDGQSAEDQHMDEGASEDEEEGSAAFEKMKTPFERAIEGRDKVRAVPTMRIFVSRTRIESLKKSSGEQSNTPVKNSK